MPVRFLFLASSSPRRAEILTKAGISFQVIPNLLKTEIIPADAPDLKTGLRRLAAQKATMSAQSHKGLILSADTVVVLNNEVLGKPDNIAEAKKTLRKLSGQRHSVITAFSLLDTETGQLISRTQTTHVTFKPLTPEWIDQYCAAHQVLDKAGSYAIQDAGNIIDAIEGSYENVVGFPIGLFKQVLRRYHYTLKEATHEIIR